MSLRCYLPAMGLINALGADRERIALRLFAGDGSGMRSEGGWLLDGEAFVGRVTDELPTIPQRLAMHRSRNNALLLAALSQIDNEVENAIGRYGRTRIGVVLGSSTSGIEEGEIAVAAHTRENRLPAGYHYAQQEVGAPAVFLAAYLGLRGPAYTISTACTSSAKAFASARRLIQLGLCDAVLVGGVDSLCKLTLNGFAALESMSSQRCNPLSRNRRGINIGEGAALFLMTRDEAPYALLGIGESSDAHHISAPDPQGIGAESAMRGALIDAKIAAARVDYLNLHATATPKNDEMESHAVARVFPEGVPTSGTKPLTGHCLGAAGGIEIAFCWLALRNGRLPQHLWDGDADPALPRLSLVGEDAHLNGSSTRVCMSNSFAFGGNNISVLIGDAQ